ncbi:PEP-CTERM protein-sorting domain-containing protein [Nitrosospira multiformis ATCC 25196]|uniref:PEP-CTERM protein-sorting domain-containing protein n=2 Tax=Nitrosospira multiformis TaxID=1231 RepID=Q2Y9L9_NITMU|nr:PEP-CTERM sorting domain-containing protein [Nitrosospira multiformis]ABB74552.1 hypothetical protein Nmul_A1249 [Nitrosospira multiformis ATCC 25196]SEF94361.1 PEP-CTERM protein-sorting domain-containing protein [Nitrosospira multiformis ATCC 25196]
MIFGGSAATADASSVITGVTASGPGLGSFSFSELGSSAVLNFSTTFSSVNPITLKFTVAHEDGTGVSVPYHIYDAIKNNTPEAFSSFHLHINESSSAPRDGVVFTSFNSADDFFAPDFTPSFTLDSSSINQPALFEPTGPRDLNFTGELKAGETAIQSYYSLDLPDPGVGNTYTFSLTQTPVAGVVPEPETYAMFLAGLGLMGFMARRKQKQSA